MSDTSGGRPLELPPAAGLNPSWAENFLGGDRELLLALLESFKEEFGQAASEVKERIAGNEKEEAAHQLHALRGGAGYIGADQLVAAAKELETAILEGQTELDPLIDEVTKNHQLVIEGISSTLASASSPEV